MDLTAIQTLLREQRIDGWLFWDFRNRDFLAYKVLGLNFEKMNTRRWFYYIPARGTPKKLVSAVEKHKLESREAFGDRYRQHGGSGPADRTQQRAAAHSHDPLV